MDLKIAGFVFSNHLFMFGSIQ